MTTQLHEPSQTPSRRDLPVTIVGGYLGSGKTTLVNHLLRNADGLRLAILCNEFGALPIDSDLIEAEEDGLITLSGGCVCCSYGNDLVMSMLDLAAMEPPFDHIVLEASGVAIPGAIAGSISLLQGFQLDGVIVLTDAETIVERSADPYMSDTITRQLNDADIIVLNKTDLVSKADGAVIVEWLQASVGHARVLSASSAKLPPAVILQSFIDRLHTFNAAESQHTDSFCTFTLKPDYPIDATRLATRLASKELGLVRAKGFVNSGNNVMKTIQSVGRRSQVADAPANVAPGIICIAVVKDLNEPPIKTLSLDEFRLVE